MKEGWLCPRCGRINNPLLLHCDCLPVEDDSNLSSTEKENSKTVIESEVVEE